MFARQINKFPKSSHTAGPSPFEVEIDIEYLNRYKLPDTDQILAGVIQSGGETLLSAVHNLVN